MIKVIKTGLTYLFAIALAVAIMFFVNFTQKYQLTPKEVYKVYLDGKVIGNIKDKQELEDYINDEQKDLKEKFGVDKVYVPSGVDIKKCTTYEKEVLTAKQVHNIIKEEKPFTIKGYKATIKSNTEGEKSIVINVLNKSMFDKAVKSVVNAFVSKDDVENYENDTQPEIKDTGSLIEDIYIDQDITIKEGYISTDEEIFTDEKKLTKYMLFGEVKDDQYYTVQDGDTIATIADKNKLAVEEFLIVNPEFTSKNNLLSAGQQVKIGLINPIIDVVVETHNVVDQESKFQTVTNYDSSLTAGVEVVETEGQNGMDRLTTKIKSVNGEMTNVYIVSSETLTPYVSEVVRLGTKSTGTYIVAASGTWAWPTLSTYYISSGFEWRWGVHHDALDIAGCGEGSPIFAAGAGTVVTATMGAGSAWSLGNYIIIDHNNGYYTLYAHMQFISVSSGQTVQKGQQIGGMGHTGNAQGTHLHFGLYSGGMPFRGGIALDPSILY